MKGISYWCGPLYFKFLRYLQKHRASLAIIFLATLLVTAWSVYTTPHIEENVCWTKLEMRIPLTTRNFDYHINCDSYGFIAAGQQFPKHFETDSTRLPRPIYPMLLKLIYSWAALVGFENTMVVAISGVVLINLILALGTAYLMYFLACRFFNQRIALGSALLILFSSHFHVYLGQAHTEIAGDFIVISCLLLIYLYTKSPSTKRLIAFSILAGTLMLLKFVFAMPIFVVLLAIWFRKFKEVMIFVPLFFLPSILWYLFVTFALHLKFVNHEVVAYQQVTWFLYILPNPSNYLQIPYALVMTVYLLIIDAVLAFGMPILLSVYGLKEWHYKHKGIITWGFFMSLALMLYAMLFGGARFAFSLYPIVFPLALYGLSVLWKKRGIPANILKIGAVLGLALTIAWSQSNVYMIMPKGYNWDYNQIRSHMQCNENIRLTC